MKQSNIKRALDILKEWVDVLDAGIVCHIQPGSTAHLNAREAVQKLTQNKDELPI